MTHMKVARLIMSRVKRGKASSGKSGAVSQVERCSRAVNTPLESIDG